jgi:hypothetical protein
MLVGCLCAVTFTSCAADLTGHDLTAHDLTGDEIIAPKPVRQSIVKHEAMLPGSARPRTRKNRDIAAEKHSKVTAENWGLQTKTAIPLPDAELLRPPIESNCELENDPEFKADDPRRLDLEKQCYREAAVITRKRLLLLQTSVDKMIKAVTGTKLSDP